MHDNCINEIPRPLLVLLLPPQEPLKGKLDKEYLRDLLKNVGYPLIEVFGFAT